MYEVNDEPGEAKPLGDEEIESSVCPLDVDYFKIEITRETFLSVVGYTNRDHGQLSVEILTPLPEMDLIRLSSGTDDIPAFSPQGLEALHVKLDSPGDYLLRVSHVAGDVTIDYQLQVQRYENTAS